MQCLFCNSSKISNSYLPDTLFNSKLFKYKQCDSCELLFIHPIPNQDDLEKMYPTSYQSGVDHTILEDQYKKLIGLRFSYGYQYDLIKKLDYFGEFIDFGCGAANFLLNAKQVGLRFNGVEFNPEHVEVLKKEIPEHKFYTVEEFVNSQEKVNLIRLSNVFEHFTNPTEQLLALKNKLKPGGFLLIEGPIEYNFNLALQFRKLYFYARKMLNKNYAASHTPTHIIFSNLRNQTKFFENIGLKTIHLEVTEAEWPFPPSFQSAQGVVGKLNVVIARVSMALSKLSKDWGNTFIYIGKV